MIGIIHRKLIHINMECLPEFKLYKLLLKISNNIELI